VAWLMEDKDSYVTSKCRDPIHDWHTVIPQKKGILSLHRWENPRTCQQSASLLAKSSKPIFSAYRAVNSFLY